MGSVSLEGSTPNNGIGYHQTVLIDCLESFRSDLLFSLESKYGYIDSRIKRDNPELILILKSSSIAEMARDDLIEHIDQTGMNLSVRLVGRSLIISIGDGQ